MAIKVNKDAVSRARKLYTSENTDLVDSMIGDSDDDELLEATERSLDSKYTDYQLGVKGSALGSAEAEAKFYNGKKYNPLHKYNSYNYIFTLSSLTADQLKTPENYGNFIQAVFGSGREASTNYIVLRSGGYPRTKVNVAMTDNFSDPEYGITPDNSVNGKTGGSGFKGLSASPGATNAKHKDLFIDNVVMETVMDLGASGVSNLTTGSFEVTEPYSVAGFYEELYNASRFAGHEHYMGAPFLLSLTFVGHRLEDGELKTEVADRSTRHFPIIFTGSNMNVSAAGARYNVQFAGFNSKANTTIANRLPQNIKGPQQATPSVSSVLTYLFNKVNDVVRKEAEEQEKGQNNDSLKKIEENEAASRKRIESAQAKNSNLKVGPYQHHNYAIWFPKKYGTNTKDELGTILQGDAFPKWESGAKDFLSPETTEDDTSLNIKKYSSDVKLDISNAIGDAAMQVTESSYTGFYSVPDLDKKVADSDEKIKTKVKEINKLKTNSSNALLEATKARQKFEEEAKKYYKLNDAEIADFRKRFTTVDDDTGEALYENKSTISYNEFRDLNPDGTNNTKDTTPPEVSSDVQEALNKLMLNYQQAIKKQNEAKRAVNRAGTELQSLVEARDSVFDEKYVRYGTSKSARNWSFKKETSLEENIHKVIFDSVYATELDGGELAQEYNKTGYIPWYRIEKIAHLKGFDTFTNTEVYDYHFIIQPFLVHYSSLPLPVSVYDYKILKEKAVREYNYIYTGKNIDVLGFDIDFNNLFAAAALYKPQQGAEGSTGTATKEKENVRPPLGDVIQALGGNRVGQKRTVAVNQTSSTTQNAPTANNRDDTAKFLHDALYSGSYEKSLINAEIEIVGDPVYLLGSGITSRASLDATNVETEAGEINCFSREGDIVFRFGTAEDMPTSDEIKGGKNTMMLDESIYSGAYKVISCTSTFNEGMFMQKLLTYRRPNQANDYVEKREPQIFETVKEADKSTAPSSQENLDKMKKKPVRKLSKEDLENLNFHGPGALGGISSQAMVEIPSANLGLNPAALGGSVFTTVAEAQVIGGQLSAGTFDIKNFVPEQAMKSIESVNGVTVQNVAGVEQVVKNTAGTSNITNASNFVGKVNDST